MNGRIGIASIIPGATFITNDGIGLIEFMTPTIASAKARYSVDELYQMVKDLVSLDANGLMRAGSDSQTGSDSQAGTGAQADVDSQNAQSSAGSPDRLIETTGERSEKRMQGVIAQP